MQRNKLMTALLLNQSANGDLCKKKSIVVLPTADGKIEPSLQNLDHEMLELVFKQADCKAFFSLASVNHHFFAMTNSPPLLPVKEKLKQAATAPLEQEIKKLTLQYLFLERKKQILIERTKPKNIWHHTQTNSTTFSSIISPFTLLSNYIFERVSAAKRAAKLKPDIQQFDLDLQKTSEAFFKHFNMYCHHCELNAETAKKKLFISADLFSAIEASNKKAQPRTTRKHF